MKQVKLLMLLPLTLGGLVIGCKGKEVAKTELTVFAAASLTETMSELQSVYEAKHKDIKLVFNFDSSGTLKTQIEQGATCDLFVSAAPKQMNQLIELNMINTDTKVDLLENKVALAVQDCNPKNVTSLSNRADRLKANESGFVLAMGNSDVPVGQYTQKIFTYFSINEETINSQGHITYGGKVKAVTSTVANAGAACGIIYQTDAKSANLTVVDTATKEMCGQVIYPAAVTANTQYTDAAKEYLSFLQSDEAMQVFENVGFSKIVAA